MEDTGLYFFIVDDGACEDDHTCTLGVFLSRHYRSEEEIGLCQERVVLKAL